MAARGRASVKTTETRQQEARRRRRPAPAERVRAEELAEQRRAMIEAMVVCLAGQFRWPKRDGR